MKLGMGFVVGHAVHVMKHAVHPTERALHLTEDVHLKEHALHLTEHAVHVRFYVPRKSTILTLRNFEVMSELTYK